MVTTRFIGGIGWLSPSQTKHIDRLEELRELTDIGKNKEPFYLGLDGEKWEPSLSALAVPVPDSGLHFFVIRITGSIFRIYREEGVIDVTDQLMAACVVKELVGSYHKG